MKFPSTMRPVAPLLYVGLSIHYTALFWGWINRQQDDREAASSFTLKNEQAVCKRTYIVVLAP